MTQFLYHYVTLLCPLRQLFQALPVQVNLVLGFLAGGYLVPTGLALATLVYWFEGATATERAANQRSVLRGLLAALIAWEAAMLAGLAWQLGLSGPEWTQAVGELACWQGPPLPNLAAAVGFALGTTLWRRDWRWGLGYCLATGLWAVAQACYGLFYPSDVIVGTVIGAGLAWLLGYADWLDRYLDVVIRFMRGLILA